jgi:hypothetical protein
LKLDSKPLLTMEATITLNADELARLNKLCSYGVAVVVPIVGKEALPCVTDPWARFLTDVRALTDAALARFKDANEVFAGRKVATSKQQAELEAGE